MALMHVNFFSQELGMCVAVDVILPQRANKQIGMAAQTRGEKHPVLWLLHGASDNHTVWGRRTSIERYAASLGLAVVMPNAHLSSYSNMAYGGNYFNYISQELPRVMRSFFPLSEKREDNFIAGLSMGGAGCMKIGLAFPENYAAIGCLSAGAIFLKNDNIPQTPEQMRRMMALNGNLDRTGTLEDPLFQAKKIVEEGKPAPRIYHACGTEDFVLKSAHYTRDFFQAFEGNPFDYTYEEDPGAHTWEFWDEHIQHFLKFIGLVPAQDIHN
ncbi:MAG: alpha/beta hydrolase family protein [Eubacteriales bacterium]|nr:alpha/beta hydrolase family protein [Eubacteriales bacterium]